MEKKIILTMQQSKEIDVTVDDHDGMTIGTDNRSVKAEDIYKLLGYARGDTYSVESVNEGNVDVPVLRFFTELFSDITGRLNRLSENQDDADYYEEEPEATNTFNYDGSEEFPF